MTRFNAQIAPDLPGSAPGEVTVTAQAATIVHHGSMDNVVPTIQTMARWIEANGYRSAGYNRELYIECSADRDACVTELQEPIATS